MVNPVRLARMTSGVTNTTNYYDYSRVESLPRTRSKRNNNAWSEAESEWPDRYHKIQISESDGLSIREKKSEKHNPLVAMCRVFVVSSSLSFSMILEIRNMQEMTLFLRWCHIPLVWAMIALHNTQSEFIVAIVHLAQMLSWLTSCLNAACVALACLVCGKTNQFVLLLHLQHQWQNCFSTLKANECPSKAKQAKLTMICMTALPSAHDCLTCFPDWPCFHVLLMLPSLMAIWAVMNFMHSRHSSLLNLHWWQLCLKCGWLGNFVWVTPQRHLQKDHESRASDGVFLLVRPCWTSKWRCLWRSDTLQWFSLCQEMMNGVSCMWAAALVAAAFLQVAIATCRLQWLHTIFQSQRTKTFLDCHTCGGVSSFKQSLMMLSCNICLAVLFCQGKGGSSRMSKGGGGAKAPLAWPQQDWVWQAILPKVHLCCHNANCKFGVKCFVKEMPPLFVPTTSLVPELNIPCVCLTTSHFQQHKCFHVLVSCFLSLVAVHIKMKTLSCHVDQGDIWDFATSATPAKVTSMPWSWMNRGQTRRQKGAYGAPVAATHFVSPRTPQSGVCLQRSRQNWLKRSNTTKALTQTTANLIGLNASDLDSKWRSCTKGFSAGETSSSLAPRVDLIGQVGRRVPGCQKLQKCEWE